MAYMQGIDISSNQSSISLANVISKNSLGFVVVKASGGGYSTGGSYVNPYFSKWAKATINAGAGLGCYHYISGDGYKTEMNTFIDTVSDYIGTAVMALDWESNLNDAWGNVSYLASCIDYFIDQTGIKPLIYVSKSYESQISDICDSYDCGEWIAQYANNNSTGLQDSPWNEGAYTCAMRQYSSAGSLTGYSGNLDLNKFYGDITQWNKYAAASSTTTSSSSTTSASTSSSSSSSTTTVSYMVKVTASAGLNMRSGAGTSYSKITALPYGQIVQITKKKSGWGYCKYGSNSGWICLDYTSKVSSYKVKITSTSGLNVRSGAGTSYSKVTAIPYGKTVSITKLSGTTWGYTTYNSKKGWIKLSYTKKV